MKMKSTGRKLGFITQEIGREINTLGSKSNQAPVDATGRLLLTDQPWQGAESAVGGPTQRQH